MRVYEQWKCTRCGHIEQVDVDDYLEIGTPMCVECGDAIEMERLRELLKDNHSPANFL